MKKVKIGTLYRLAGPPRPSCSCFCCDSEIEVRYYDDFHVYGELTKPGPFCHHSACSWRDDENLCVFEVERIERSEEI